jgi:hypothetical protein
VAEEHPEGAPESGKEFREKFERTAAELRAAKALLAEQSVQGLKYVKPEDLAEVDLTQMGARAAELEAQREQEQTNLLKAALESRGLSGDDLDAALQNLTGTKPATEVTETPSQVATLGRLPGTAPGKSTDDGLFGQSRLEAAFGA